MKRIAWIAAILIGPAFALPASADTAAARCDIYPAGEDRATASLDCQFSQRQGYVTIIRADGVVHDLTPVGDRPGNFRDAEGRAVYRNSGLGDQGQIFRFPDISIFLYWQRAGATTDAADSPTAPFSTADYDATTILTCRASASAAPADCPAGVLRIENGQGSVTILDPEGKQFTINVMKDATTGEPYVNATNREAEARREGDGWIVTIDGSQIYEIPDAVIEGG